MYLFHRGKQAMNEIYQTPLLTSWPMPVDFGECFNAKGKGLKNKVKNGAKKASRVSFFLNLLSFLY
jgi:hypothetical protein